MEEIVIDSNVISQINGSLQKAKNAVETQGYTEAGIEIRKVAEVFTTVILEKFLGESSLENCSSLDEKIKAIRDDKCMLRKETDLLFDVKSYGNNVAHINKSFNFNPKLIVELFPNFAKLVEDYLSNINEKYDAYLSRFEFGEAELFERFDAYIKVATQTFSSSWKKAYEENGFTQSLYGGAPVLPKEYIDNENMQTIKKNLYNASKILMDIVCKFNMVNVESPDYITLVEKLEQIRQINQKQRNRKNSLKYNYPMIVQAKIRECSYVRKSNPKAKTLYHSHSCLIVETSSDSEYQPFSYEVVRNYEPSSYPLPLVVRKTMQNEFVSASFCYDYEFMPSFFSEIRNLCEDGFYNGSEWDRKIYGYIRMVHQVAENLKVEHEPKYPLNPMTEIIHVLDDVIIKEENAALEKGLALLDRFKAEEEKIAKDYREQKKLDTELSLKQAKIKELKLKNSIENAKARKALLWAIGWISCVLVLLICLVFFPYSPLWSVIILWAFVALIIFCLMPVKLGSTKTKSGD